MPARGSDVAQQREDLCCGQALGHGLHAAAREGKVDSFSTHRLDRAECGHAARRRIVARRATLFVDRASVLRG